MKEKFKTKDKQAIKYRAEKARKELEELDDSWIDDELKEWISFEEEIKKLKDKTKKND